jgi:hypothetical protein
MATVVPCCGPAVQNYWHGSYCRCCGASILIGNLVVGCGRHTPCPHCGKLTCGPHSHDGSGGWQVRRICEIDGQPCNNGVCPSGGMHHA